MEGEKELLAKIKNSKRDGLNDIEITKRLLNKGYKLDYINLMISKSKKVKKIFWVVLTTLFILITISLTYLIYTNYSSNPQDYAKQLPTPSIGTSTANYVKTNITRVLPNHISSLLYQMKATTLRKNPLTFEKPKICFKIGSSEYLSIVDGNTIQTKEELCKKQDINIILSEETALSILNSQNIATSIEDATSLGNLNIERVASDIELGAKGYLSLQESFRG